MALHCDICLTLQEHGVAGIYFILTHQIKINSMNHSSCEDDSCSIGKKFQPFCETWSFIKM